MTRSLAPLVVVLSTLLGPALGSAQTADPPSGPAEGAPAPPAEVPAPAEDPGADDGRAGVDRPSGEPAAPAPARRKTVVIGFSSPAELEPGLLDALTEALVFEVAQSRERETLGPSDLQGLLDVEAQKALVGCGDPSCLGDLAAALDARRVITGHVEPLGGGWYVQLTELDLDEGAPVARAQRRLLRRSLRDALLPELRALVQELGRAEGPLADRGTLLVTSVPPAEVVLDGKTWGRTPTLIDGAPPGTARLLLLTDDEELEVQAEVFSARVTTVDVELNTELAASTAELEAYDTGTLWAYGSATALGLAGAACCAATPVSVCVGCITWQGLASSLGLPGNGNVSVGTTDFQPALVVAPLVHLVGSCGLGAAGGGALLFAPDAPEASPPLHRVRVRPPRGEGEPRTLYLDPDSGEPVEPGRPDGVTAAPPPEAAPLAIAY